MPGLVSRFYWRGDDYLPVVIVDDDQTVRGKRVHGLRVEAPERLADLVEKYGATSVLLAIPSATRRQRRRVLEKISEIPVRVQTIPDITDIISGRARIIDLSAIDVADLLGRNAVPPNPRLLRISIAGKKRHGLRCRRINWLRAVPTNPDAKAKTACSIRDFRAHVV